MTRLVSTLDSTVNFLNGAIEARYVRRTPEYFTCYLSSQHGCRQACRMCHLTKTGQTNDANIPESGIIAQALTVLDHYKTQPTARFVNFAFMARGEPLANPDVSDDCLIYLMNLARRYKLIPRVSVSTIFPHHEDLASRFPVSKPDIYYSVYSTSEAFRKHWLPKALPVRHARDILVEYQRTCKKVPTLHWAFIEGQNDSLDDIADICNLFEDLLFNVNIVRYNPFDSTSKESPNISQLYQYLRLRLAPRRVRVIDRVGSDVYASCGQFVPK